MAGHSKWSQIKHKKGANDAKRGKIFTKHARLIAIAAKNGGDPEQNPQLRAAIEYAKVDNVPNDNIDRAIKKGSGESGDEAQLEELTYEGYGPAGVAMLILTVTDNRNRSFANVRTIMTKNGGNMGESGSVGYMFEKKGLFLLEVDKEKTDEQELQIIECGAEDLKQEDDKIEVYTAPDEFFEVKQKLESLGMQILESKLTLICNNYVEINDVETAQKVLNLIEKLEEDDDVMEVIANFDISQEIVDQIE